LRKHACLRLRRSSGALALWSLNDNGHTIEVAVSGPLIANDFPTLLGAAVQGVGLAQMPEPVASASVKAGELVQVLQKFAPTTPGVFLYYPSQRQMLPKLRAFIDHIKNRPQPKERTKAPDRPPLI
jgi:DNA-binding transcriptional LysR family regulator